MKQIIVKIVQSSYFDLKKKSRFFFVSRKQNIFKQRFGKKNSSVNTA